MQRRGSWRRSQEEHGPPLVSWVTGKANRLDTAAPCDSGRHLGSGRAFFKGPGLQVWHAFCKLVEQVQVPRLLGSALALGNST